jgi:hypothetical protein
MNPVMFYYISILKAHDLLIEKLFFVNLRLKSYFK